jgi:hypothetical protein
LTPTSSPTMNYQKILDNKLTHVVTSFVSSMSFQSRPAGRILSAGPRSLARSRRVLQVAVSLPLPTLSLSPLHQFPLRMRLPNSLGINTCKSVSKQKSSTPLESTLAKVYQNKRVQLPLESTLIKNRGGISSANSSSTLLARRSQVTDRSSFTSSTSSIPFTSFLFRTLFTLRVRRNRRNPFSFFRFRTLAKTMGGGGGGYRCGSLSFSWSFP